LNRDYFKIFPNLYILLVGDAGSGKNTARNIAARKLVIDNFPDIPVSASVTTREDVCKFMGSEDGLRTFHNPDGSIQEYHPFFFSVDELSNLLSVDFRKTVDFLVDLYDSEFFSTSFKHDTTKDKIPFPCATMLACTIPDWFMRSMKMDLFTGGLGRRLTIVYENKSILIAEPTVPPGGHEAWKRVVEHLQTARELIGEMKLSPSCVKWWNKWYENDKRLETDDPILRQIYSTKHVILQKVAMLTALDERPFRMVLEPDDFVKALAMLDLLEPPLRKLSAGVGRNELAAISVQFMDTLACMHGVAAESKLRNMFFRDCKVQGNEFNLMVKHLMDTDQIMVMTDARNGKPQNYVFLPDAYERYQKEKKM